MKNVQANQFYPDEQNVMATHQQETILEHFKTAGSICKGINRREQNHAFVIDLHVCRYYFRRFHTKFSSGLAYNSVAQNETLITQFTI